MYINNIRYYSDINNTTNGSNCILIIYIITVTFIIQLMIATLLIISIITVILITNLMLATDILII